MKIAVCVKQVPDTWAEKKLSPADYTLDRAAADGVLNEIDEYAIEEALQLVEKHGGEVTIVTMGPDKALETVRKALSMGANDAVLLSDEALHGSDALATSYALSQVLAGRGFDLILFGSESTDARMSVVPAMVAERLQLPQLTFANKVDVDGGTVTIQRTTEYGYDTVRGATPAVVSVVEKINEPRYPSFKGIMAAKKKPVEKLDAAGAGLEADKIGLAASWSQVESFADRPPRAQGQVVADDGTGGAKIAEFLVAQKLI